MTYLDKLSVSSVMCGKHDLSNTNKTSSEREIIYATTDEESTPVIKRKPLVCQETIFQRSSNGHPDADISSSSEDEIATPVIHRHCKSSDYHEIRAHHLSVWSSSESEIPNLFAGKKVSDMHKSLVFQVIVDVCSKNVHKKTT